MRSIRKRLMSLFIAAVITMASLIAQSLYNISWATPAVRVDRIPGEVTEVRGMDLTVAFESDHKPQPGDLVRHEGKGSDGYKYLTLWRVKNVHGKTVKAEAERVERNPHVGMKVVIESLKMHSLNLKSDIKILKERAIQA